MILISLSIANVVIVQSHLLMEHLPNESECQCFEACYGGLWLINVVTTLIFTPFSSTDILIKLLPTQLWFTGDSFVLTGCFEISGKIRFA